MANVDLSQFRQLYNQTALEYVKKLEENLAVLREDPANKESMNEMFISSHSLKSQSLLMGHTSLAEASLALEASFRALRDGIEPLSPEVINAVTTVVHAIKASLANIAQTGKEIDLYPAIIQYGKVIKSKG